MRVQRRQDNATQAHARCCRGHTYSDCGEDILQLVHKGDKGRVVDVDAVTLLALDPSPHPQMPLEHNTHALGFVAIVGGERRWIGLCGQYAHEAGYVGGRKLFVRAPMAVFGNLGAG